ncbi:MAG: UDP-N-acetylmuramoyl-L-alanine--D-glutamate ligase [Peptoniphilus sp.]|nr:UDP-N-acetylmuramoyl-L-alanine--D-glutamate ligase [Peptoniphilus sp.]MDY3118610.1 UDP-N-acetylmuramoyl-L-alanine--D-glutamate ligase [Peptoniphilus sp.]
MKNKSILIYGLGTTGLSAIDALKDENTLYIYDDDKSRASLLAEAYPFYDGEAVDFVVKSPGITLDSGWLPELVQREIPVISDIEVAYRLSDCENFIAVTGTNGKTTTTDLLYHLLIDGGKIAYVGGNIGVGVLPLAKRAKKDDYLVIECSSFQLETTLTFKPKVAILTNITEDHLDHHKSVEAYRKSKQKAYANQDDSDVLILNIDDPYLAMIGEEMDDALVVSTTPVQQDGAYKDQEKLYLSYKGERMELMDRSDMALVGDHNVRNALEAALCAYVLGVDVDSIRKTLRNYRGVSHRMEFVGTYRDVDYYNDSKGTNPDSTDVALSSLTKPIHLLAGGFDKGSDFKALFEKHAERIACLYVFGATKAIIKEEALEAGVKDIMDFDTMDEAANAAMDRARAGEAVLLSPACASWDQFPNYEVRGDEFKRIVKEKWS